MIAEEGHTESKLSRKPSAVRYWGIEIGLPSLLALLVCILLLTILVLLFMYLLVAHLTAWADADGIAKVLGAIWS